MKSSIAGVKTNVAYAQEAAAQIDKVIKGSEQSEQYAKNIDELTGQQTSAVVNIKTHIESVLNISKNNIETATHNATIATQVLFEVERMNSIVIEEEEEDNV